jgi:outer membrane biosynthesis protein TonB
MNVRLFGPDEDRLINVSRSDVWIFWDIINDSPEPPPVPTPVPVPTPTPIPTPEPPTSTPTTPPIKPAPVPAPAPAPVPTVNLTFVVTDSTTDLPVEDATVSIDQVKNKTDMTGRAVFTNIAPGNRRYTVNKKGFKRTTGMINVTGEMTVPVRLVPK